VWTYHQRSGLLIRGLAKFQCYAGRGEGRNNPAMEHVQGVGPIPKGRYRMTGVKHNGSTGPYTIILQPVGHGALGRSLFRIHGDNKESNASHGCIIRSPRADRELIYELDKDLMVVA
jgi:hypothetical protein